MTKFDDRVDELLSKHPNLTKEEVVNIVTEKNARKKAKRAEKTERSRLNMKRKRPKTRVKKQNKSVCHYMLLQVEK